MIYIHNNYTTSPHRYKGCKMAVANIASSPGNKSRKVYGQSKRFNSKDQYISSLLIKGNKNSKKT